MSDKRRWQLFVDRRVQGALLARVAIYWLTFLLCVALLEACWIVVTQGPRSSAEMFAFTWAACGPAIVGSLLLLPLVLIDCLRLSNRFVGPVLRLRRAMNGLIDGERIAPVDLRSGDFWFDVAEDFNRLGSYVNELQRSRFDDLDGSTKFEVPNPK